jgi:hypothetical protein
MPDLLNYLITALIAATAGAIAPILVARFSKTREERESGLASDYLKIADMSGEQLEKKINQVNVLEAKTASLQAQIIAMQIDHNTQQVENLKVIEALKDYIKVLIGVLREHDMEVPPRPEILRETNPKMKALK